MKMAGFFAGGYLPQFLRTTDVEDRFSPLLAACTEMLTIVPYDSLSQLEAVQYTAGIEGEMPTAEGLVDSKELELDKITDAHDLTRALTDEQTQKSGPISPPVEATFNAAVLVGDTFKLETCSVDSLNVGRETDFS